MCGIVLGKLEEGNLVNKFIRKQYSKQISRGTEGYGFVTFTNGQNPLVYRATKEHQIMRLLKQNPSSHILFHHRNPSSSPNLLTQTHPFVVTLGNYTVIVVHNGVISNSSELKLKHEKIGYKYSSEQVWTGKEEVGYYEYNRTTKKREFHKTREYKVAKPVFNDSEALAYELAAYFSGKSSKTILESSILGWCAFVAIVMKDKKVEDIYLYRDYTAPLEIQSSNNKLSVASELGYGDKLDACKLYKIKDFLVEEVEELLVGDTIELQSYDNNWDNTFNNVNTKFPEFYTLRYDSGSYELKDVLNRILAANDLESKLNCVNDLIITQEALLMALTNNLSYGVLQ
jgi:predicted glutamine amidotransferase